MKTLLLAILISLLPAAGCSSPEEGPTPAPGTAIDAEEIDRLVAHVSGARLVLLGEASHGTREFYQWRKAISRRLIEDYDFDFIAVEGDWPAHHHLNLYVRGRGETEDIGELFSVFDRWPPWMWRNRVTADLVRWLRDFNREEQREVGFYGMDVYGIPRSFARVREEIRELAPESADRVEELLECIGRYASDMHSYARDLSRGLPGCADQLAEAREYVRTNVLEDLEPHRALNLDRNLSVLLHGERHYRAMVDPGMDNWNERVEFMRETVEELLRFHGPASRGIIWAHNTHVGDARATIMTQRGQVNIGQLLRETHGPDRVRIIGFGTGTGTVKAGREWGAPGVVMEIPDPVEGSYEYLFQQEEGDRLVLLFGPEDRRESPLLEPRGHRAIGVVYQPEREHLGNFVPSILPHRYDAFIFFRSTTALREL